jgi:formylglycine-generating enzyme
VRRRTHVEGFTLVSQPRDIDVDSAREGVTASAGRNVIAVIGIDRYRYWQRLSNAVCDARGAAAMFERLGFEQATEPLLDDAATGTAMQALVTDDLAVLQPDDSLVVFYAGHGGTRKHHVGDRVIKTGYLIPVDANDKVATWIDLEGWLRALALLPARHILVVLDACHSGIALAPILSWRDGRTWHNAPLATLATRRSRRIITSALDDQVALDTGPVHGHSLFTGCLIEGLTYGIRPDSRVTTGSELGLYLQRRVETYPESRQTPDFGTFAFDERGEMLIHLPPGLGKSPKEGCPTIPAPAPTMEKPIATPTSGGRVSRRVIIGAVTALVVASLGRLGYEGYGANQGGAADKRSPLEAPVDVVATAPPDAALGDAVSDVAAYGTVDARKTQAAAPPPRAPRGNASGVTAPGTGDGQPRPRKTQPTAPPPEHCPPRMVLVPAGRFVMGSPHNIGEPHEHPMHDVTLSAYCIDRTEVTVNLYAACVRAGDCTASRLTVSWSGYSADELMLFSRFCNGNDRPDHPINCIDWDQATAYCKWAGRRLPTEAEWEYAARGTDGRTYPWGNEVPSAKRLNACGAECVAMANRDLDRSWTGMHDGNDAWETTAPVGSFREGASPFGALDMAGNVHEWTADWYGAYSSAASMNPHGAEMGSGRVFRGGSWDTNAVDTVRASNRDGTAPSTRRALIGFRCVRRPY